MTSKTDLIVGPELFDFNATDVRVEYDSDAGASYLGERFGYATRQVKFRKSYMPEIIKDFEKHGVTYRVADVDSELTGGGR